MRSVQSLVPVIGVGCLAATLTLAVMTQRSVVAQQKERPPARQPAAAAQPRGRQVPGEAPTKELPKPGAEIVKEIEASSYRPTVPDRSLDATMAQDVKDKDGVMQRQQALLAQRYDLADRPLENVLMSGKRKAVQGGVRIRLPEGLTWERLAAMPADEIRERGLFPAGFLPLPHTKHEVGGQVIPQKQIDEIEQAERRPLQRFDVDFDLPDHLTPEFPPPIFLTTHPELGDVSEGKVLTLKNFFGMFNGKLTPVQIEGLRNLLTPFPQEEFNQTDDRKTVEPAQGISCLDCHVNFHTNAAFHLNPDTRPQSDRMRLDTPSLRGMFNQQIHGSKRSLRSIEDFTEFEQHTAYFNGDHVSAARKGRALFDRKTQVAHMAQVQNMIDFPPAPKLNTLGLLDPQQASQQELLGQEVFFGKGRCGVCHPAPFYLDDKMHDLRLERFFKEQIINGQRIHGDGPMKTFTLRGIKDTPPYFHDGRLLTLDDTVEFFNVVLGTQLTAEEKQALVAFMLAL